MVLLVCLAAGCEYSGPDDSGRLDVNLQSHYEIAKTGSSARSPKERRIDRQRLRMQFGDVAE
jgi:hypothetical protein